MNSIKQPKIIMQLIIILLIGFLFRVYGINWDQGFHLHPDERAIVMYALPLTLPLSINEFFSVQSPLNPHFFAYGNFPLYLVKGVSEVFRIVDVSFTQYDKINILGRFISAFADLGTIIIIFFIGKNLFNKTVGIFASFLYAVSVFPIQASHFYAVDILLTFFITTTIYLLLTFYDKPTKKRAVLIGIFFGLSLVTKISALALASAIIFSLAADLFLIFLKHPHKPRHYLPHIPIFLKRLITKGVIIFVTAGITFAIFQPYAIIDFQEFLKQNLQQQQMTKDAFTFPYTLQYVGKIPYVYELTNIFFWGLGPILGTASVSGFFYLLYLLFHKHEKNLISKEIIYLLFFITYFAVVGKFAVGWMRYMLPLYPFFVLFGALFFWRLSLLSYFTFKVKYIPFLILNFLFVVLILMWPLSFINIYTKPNTRVLATNWINENIPNKKTLALEHWDDGLPLVNQQNYSIETLELYQPDTPEKWAKIKSQLIKSDYIILASNRLYVPLQKLTNCTKLPPGRCYKEAAEYYKKLFNGTLGFRKVAEFTSYPTLEIGLPLEAFAKWGNWKLEIRDDAADESFTVYDHPKVTIFQKI